MPAAVRAILYASCVKLFPMSFIIMVVHYRLLSNTPCVWFYRFYVILAFNYFSCSNVSLEVISIRQGHVFYKNVDSDGD